MNIFRSHYLHLKSEAALLLKFARRSGTSQEAALDRFRKLELFHGISATDGPTLASLKLKHACSVLALENGFETWTEMKSSLDRFAAASPLAEITDQFYPHGMAAFSNIWFAEYMKAKSVLTESGGYLLPYKQQCFICEAGFVDRLGISPTLKEWRLIGFDWIRPAHVKAWLKLNDLYASIRAL